MKIIKQIVEPLIRRIIRKNMVTPPKVIDFEKKQCIGYQITTTFKGNQKKKDIPPFYHDVYDNDKLNALRQDDDPNMYCIFDLHENGRDFDYYVAAENKSGIHGDGYAEITLPEGRYVQVEFVKRNHSAAALIVMYIRVIWTELNGYEERKSPLFILYDERFHRNYEAFGCEGENYLGNPIAVLHVPVK